MSLYFVEVILNKLFLDSLRKLFSLLIFIIWELFPLICAQGRPIETELWKYCTKNTFQW